MTVTDNPKSNNINGSEREITVVNFPNPFKKNSNKTNPTIKVKQIVRRNTAFFEKTFIIPSSIYSLLIRKHPDVIRITKRSTKNIISNRLRVNDKKNGFSDNEGVR